MPRSKPSRLGKKLVVLKDRVAELENKLARSEQVRTSLGQLVEHVTQDKEMLVATLQAPYRVLRLVEYCGPREWVEETVARSIHGTHFIDQRAGKQITAVTLTEYPEVLDLARNAVDAGRQLIKRSLEDKR